MLKLLAQSSSASQEFLIKLFRERVSKNAFKNIEFLFWINIKISTLFKYVLKYTWLETITLATKNILGKVDKRYWVYIIFKTFSKMYMNKANANKFYLNDFTFYANSRSVYLTSVHIYAVNNRIMAWVYAARTLIAFSCLTGIRIFPVLNQLLGNAYAVLIVSGRCH